MNLSITMRIITDRKVKPSKKFVSRKYTIRIVAKILSTIARKLKKPESSETLPRKTKKNIRKSERTHPRAILIITLMKSLIYQSISPFTTPSILMSLSG